MQPVPEKSLTNGPVPPWGTVPWRPLARLRDSEGHMSTRQASQIGRCNPGIHAKFDNSFFERSIRLFMHSFIHSFIQSVSHSVSHSHAT